MNTTIGSACFAVVIVPLAVIGWMIAAHNMRIWRVHRLARTVSCETRNRILSHINNAGRINPVCALMIPTLSQPEASGNASKTASATEREKSRPDELGSKIDSRFGGWPYMEQGDEWPTLDESPGSTRADFLIQIRLSSPLPSNWDGCLAVVFLKHDVSQTVRIYVDPSPEKFVQSQLMQPSESEITLRPVLIPSTRSTIAESDVNGSSDSEDLRLQSDERDWQLPYDPTRLIGALDDLKADLKALTNSPADLLAQLLVPGLYGYDLDLSDVVQVGGEPQWIQDDPRSIDRNSTEGNSFSCTICNQPMRFLFQFGDLTGKQRLGDAGVAYVFGCDTHLSCTQSVTQMF